MTSHKIKYEILVHKFKITILIIIGGILILLGFSTNDNLVKTFYSNLGIKDQLELNEYILKPQSITENTLNPNYLVAGIMTCKSISPTTIQISTDNNNTFVILNKNFTYKDVPEPNDLVSLAKLEIPTLADQQLRFEAAQNLKTMFQELNKLGIKATISSSYRTRQEQEKMFKMWSGLVGPILAKNYAASPGSSEHHLGTTVDIITYENNLKLLPSYDKTKLKSWLDQNAVDYGFTNSYPKGKEEITGYAYEPWHYRYVGKDVASYLKSNNLTLTEYLYRLHHYCLMD